MRHAVDHRKLGRNPSHRKALLRNLMNALVKAERIETTVPRAKELRRLADKLITLGKKDTVHARRLAFALLCDKANTEKLFAGLAGRFAARPGGYTRIMRTGYRDGDGADMAIIEYLPAEEKKAAGKGKKKKKAPAAGAKKAAPKAPAGKAGKEQAAGGKRRAERASEGAGRAEAKPKRTRTAKTSPKGADTD